VTVHVYSVGMLIRHLEFFSISKAPLVGFRGWFGVGERTSFVERTDTDCDADVGGCS
jgi:hypothetical protein